MAKNSIVVRKSKSIWGWLMSLLIVAVVAGLAYSTYFYHKKYQDVKSHPVSADQAAKNQIESYKTNVAKLYANLPTDEQPTVYSITDKEQLKDQPFFAKAENGDVSLIYTNAKLAILYRPSTNQIINVSTINIQSQSKAKILGAQADRQAVAKVLDDNYKATVSYEQSGEPKTDVTKTLVVDLNGKLGDLAQKIADSLKGKVGALPSGETKPDNTDLVIIVAPSE